MARKIESYRNQHIYQGRYRVRCPMGWKWKDDAFAVNPKDKPEMDDSGRMFAPGYRTLADARDAADCIAGEMLSRFDAMGVSLPDDMRTKLAGA